MFSQAEGYIQQNVNDSYILFHPFTEAVHNLEPPASTIYESCSEAQSYEQLKAQFSGLEDEIFDSAIQQLLDAEVLVVSEDAPQWSRRDFVGKAAAVLVLSVSLPRAAGAASAAPAGLGDQVECYSTPDCSGAPAGMTSCEGCSISRGFFYLKDGCCLNICI